MLRYTMRSSPCDSRELAFIQDAPVIEESLVKLVYVHILYA